MAFLCFKIFFLQILTLGIYYFWGKAAMRRKIWSAIHIEGQRLEYSGTGKELFFGFLRALVLFFIPGLFLIGLISLMLSSLIDVIVPGSEAADMIPIAFIYLVLFYFFGLAQYTARRYLLSRTSWRGVRAALVGVPFDYAWTYLWTLVMAVVTLGWALPWRSVKLTALMTNATRFGDEPLKFAATARPLYFPFAVMWGGILALLLVLPLLGYLVSSPKYLTETSEVVTNPWSFLTIVLPLFFMPAVFGVFVTYYYSRLVNYLASHTSLQQARFSLTTTTRGLIWLYVSNFLLTLLTLGIAYPVAELRSARYYIQRTKLTGTVDFQQIARNNARLSTTGEGLAEVYDELLF